MIAAWPSPAGGEEYAVAFDAGREKRLLVLPALFDESNKLRHFTAALMRRLDDAGIDSFLPDLPGCNESLAPLADQTAESWQAAAQAAATHFRATHFLAIRGGSLFAPTALPGWRYAAVPGKSLLRAMLRARVLASKEAGIEENRDQLLELGRSEGLDLAGYRIGPAMLSALENAEPAQLEDISQGEVGGAGLWLRAEPDHSPEQADTLAAILVQALSA